MSDVLEGLIRRHHPEDPQDWRQALKEVLQELALLGLWRAKFFEHAAFYGGTALRILHHLPRFSEDLDFSLLQPSHDFSFDRYARAIETELASYGLKVRVRAKVKSVQSAIFSAFLKADTLEQLLRVGIPQAYRAHIHDGERIRIRIEIDTAPPPSFTTYSAPLLRPFGFSIRAFSPPDQMAGKLHALLFRQWKRRIKGRDWFDFAWLVGQGVPVNLAHLEARMRQTGHFSGYTALTLSQLRQWIQARIASLDIDLAKQDLQPFLPARISLDEWSSSFFEAVTDRLAAV